jgi:nucleotidyltransferase/DNA polymerase involved in DNA repair
MPGFIGKKLCPELVIVSSNFKMYSEVSQQVREIMAHYDPNFCPMSLDEAYLNFTAHLKNRLEMADVERTFLLRGCDVFDSMYCLCDLNMTLRASVLSQEISDSKINTDESHLDPQSDAEDIINKDDNCDTRDKNITDQDQSGSVQEQSGSVQDQSGSIQEQSGSIQEQSASIQEQSASMHQRSGTEHATNEIADTERRNWKCLEICPECEKPFPAYEVVTFGSSVEEAVREFRSRIEQRTRLTASAGT